MPFVFDTNVAVVALRDPPERDRFHAFIRSRRAQVLLHAAVWAELQAGARTPLQQELLDAFVRPFVERGRVLVPTVTAWHQAGRVLARLADRDGVDTRRSAIHYDAIIAASARETGVTIVTRNARDFALMRPHLSKLEYAAPYP